MWTSRPPTPPFASQRRRRRFRQPPHRSRKWPTWQRDMSNTVPIITAHPTITPQPTRNVQQPLPYGAMWPTRCPDRPARLNACDRRAAACQQVQAAATHHRPITHARHQEHHHRAPTGASPPCKEDPPKMCLLTLCLWLLEPPTPVVAAARGLGVGELVLKLLPSRVVPMRTT
jgi:hypothetical protein